MKKAQAENPHTKSTWAVYGPVLLVTLIALVIAFQYVDPPPPRLIRLATGRDGGGYQAHALQLRSELAKNGITVELVSSEGAIDNLGRLRAGTVDLAFVQGGTAAVSGREAGDDALRSIASVYYEPAWVFHRAGLEVGALGDLQGRNIGVGVPGSGTRAVALTLLAENGVTEESSRILPASGADAADALIKGELDAVFLVGVTTDIAVDRLLRAADITTFDFVRAAAYARRHRFLSTVDLPRGAVDLELDLPKATKRLIAPTAQLVTTESFHPALIDLLLESADLVFHHGDLVQSEREFPSLKFLDYPASEISRRYFRSGRPFLYRYLPFRVAAFLDRMKILLLPLLTLVFPLVKLVPPLYRWRVRSRIYCWYRDLLRIESGVDTGTIEDPGAELDALWTEVGKLTVPPSYADDLYQLKHHIEVVRRRLGV